MKEFLKRLFNRKKQENESPIGKCFKQTCVFAHSELRGDKRIFPMQSGAIYLVVLVDIDAAGYQFSADDTAQRDLTWKVLDVVAVKERVEDKTKIVTAPRFGSIIVTDEMVVMDRYRDFWQIVNDLFISKFFPEQNKGFRMLRG